MTSGAATKVINSGAPSSEQAPVDRAADVSGKSRTDFLDASCEKAREVLADWTHFALSRPTLQRFKQLIEVPLADMDALKRMLSTSAPWER